MWGGVHACACSCACVFTHYSTHGSLRAASGAGAFLPPCLRQGHLIVPLCLPPIPSQQLWGYMGVPGLPSFTWVLGI